MNVFSYQYDRLIMKFGSDVRIYLLHMDMSSPVQPYDFVTPSGVASNCLKLGIMDSSANLWGFYCDHTSCGQTSSLILIASNVSKLYPRISQEHKVFIYLLQVQPFKSSMKRECLLTDRLIIDSKDMFSCIMVHAFVLTSRIYSLLVSGDYSYSLYSVFKRKIVQVYSSKGKKLVTGGSADTTIVRWNDEKKRLIISHLDVDRSQPDRPLLRLSRLVYAVRF